MNDWAYAIKKIAYPAEQRKTSVRLQRRLYQEQVKDFDNKRLIFIDESGSHLGMARLYGRALGGKRIKSFLPFDKGKRVTLIAAMGACKIQAALFGHWHTNGELFLGFIKDCLVPVLRAGDLVVMDNLSAHKVVGVREAIEAQGAQLIYLPPYSPDLNPIELCWSKIKAYLRKKAARTLDELQLAICEAFQTIHAKDIQGWFKHCGYIIH